MSTKPNKNNRIRQLTLDDFWEEVADIQFDESALAEAIYISAARDSRTLPVGCSPDHFRQAVYLSLPGFPLAARAGSDWLLWYLKVLCKLYFPNYSHESDEIDLLVGSWPTGGTPARLSNRTRENLTAS